MIVAVSFLAFALLVALLTTIRANGRERQDIRSDYDKQIARLERMHRAELAAVNADRDALRVERGELLDRLQFPEVSQTAAAFRSLPEPPKPAPDLPPVYVPVTDDDLRLSQELD